MARFLFSIFILLIFFSCPLCSRADEAVIFIDPSDTTLIRKTEIPFESQVLLKADDLPQQSRLHPSIEFTDQKFTYLALSPDRSLMAFSVRGRYHSWSGVYHFESKKVRELAFRFKSLSTVPHWSPDGRYLVIEEVNENGQKFFGIFDLEKETHCDLTGRMAKNKFFDFSLPWWSKQSQKIYFQVEMNNEYRQSLGLKPRKMAPRIGEATPQCQGVVLRSVAKFIRDFPSDPIPPEVTSLVQGYEDES